MKSPVIKIQQVSLENSPKKDNNSSSEKSPTKKYSEYEFIQKKQKQVFDIRKNFQQSLKTSKVKKVIIYEETQEQKRVNTSELTKEQRINLIRYGPDSINN